MARKQPFQYNTLLRVRKTQENLRAQALAQVRRQRRSAEHQRDDLARQQREMLQEANALVARRFDSRDVRRYYLHERYLARLADEKDSAIRELTAREQERLAELEAAIKDRRLIERLKEKRTKAFEAEMRKEAQAFSDEAATNQAAMSRRGERGS